MTRYVPVTVLVAMLAASRVASAQATLPGGVTVSFDKLYIHEDGSQQAIIPKVDPDSKWKYFNLAHCQCGKDMAGSIESTFEFLMLASAASPAVSEPLNIWVGTSCSESATTRSTNCHAITGQAPSIASIQSTNSVRVTIPIYDAMMPAPAEVGKDCIARQQSISLWGLADSTIGSGMLDYATTPQAAMAITADSAAPPLPTNFRAEGGERAIQLSWTPATDTSDVYAYQALCARADGGAAGASGLKARYMTAKILCRGTQSVDLGSGTEIPPPTTGPPGDAVTLMTLPAAVQDLDPKYLCGEAVASTASGMRIEGLENGEPYSIVLLAVDKYQNATGTFFTTTVTPVASTDAWEDLHNRGSQVQGGLCLLAETYGDGSALTGALRAFRDDTLGGSRAGRWLGRAYYATLGKLGALVHGSFALRVVAGVVLAPLVALALLWHWLTLPGLLGLIALAWWLRRRRATVGRSLRRVLQPRMAQAVVVLAVVVLGASHAHAGGGYQPYWEDSAVDANENAAAADDPGLVKWHVGVRVGRYIPDIDKQLGGTSPGPYAQMFGGARVLPMLDVDRFLWNGFGQLGVGLSLGYMQKTARSFTLDSMPTDNPRPRAADENKFRLIPMALTATYRLTWLDDQYGIPLVPYVRGGLAYYLWWITTADGNLATVCKAGGTEPTCAQNKALGASLGVQGSLGLAIRAERIDPSTAQSMRQSGIEHAGIYAEWSLAKVDGFGSDKKLSVGDRTWFAGIDFEF